MESSTALMARYLDPASRRSLVKSLVSEVARDPQALSALVALSEDLDPETFDSIFEELYKYVITLTDNLEMESQQNVCVLVSKIPKLTDAWFLHVTQYLETYVHQNPLDIWKSYKTVIVENHLVLVATETEAEAEVEVSKKFLIGILGFIERTLEALGSSSTYLNSKLDNCLLVLLGNQEPDISSRCSKLLRWRINQITEERSSNVVWDIIYLLETIPYKASKDHAYIFWLRYLNFNSANLGSSKLFQQRLATDKYWEVLKSGLTSEYHDHRKYCLSILQLSLKSVNCSFFNSVITWDNEERDKYLREWKRFATVYEIIAIDASLHQAEAAINDIMSLLSSKDSLIHPSWGICLFANGFRAAMDSMRKFTRSLLFSVPNERLGLFKYDLASFENIILPYAMQALNFVVKYNDTSKQNECIYGQALSNLILNMLMNIADDEDVLLTATAIFNVLVRSKDAFDPSRIYVALGMLNGLGDGCLKFGTHESQLTTLFECSCEGFVYENCSQTIFLRLLTKFKVEESLSDFLDTLRKFTKFNGTEILLANAHILGEFVVSNGFDIINEVKSNNSSDDKKALLIPLLLDENKNKDEIVQYVVSQNKSLFCYLIECNLLNGLLMDDNVEMQQFSQANAKYLLLESRSFELLDAVSKTNVTTKLSIADDQDYVTALELIKQELKSKDYHSCQIASRRLRLMKTLYLNSGYVFDLQSLLLFEKYVDILKKSPNLKEHLDHYKLVELIQADHLQLIQATLERSQTVVDFRAIFALMNTSSTSFDLNVAMISLIKFILGSFKDSSLVEDLTGFLAELWENISSSRLKLNENRLHLLIIEAMLDKKIIDVSLDSEVVSQQLLVFCLSVIENSYGRRSLLPTLTRKISEYQLLQPSRFSKLKWIPEVFVGALTMNQLKTNSFKLETVVGDLFDSVFPGGPEPLYKSIYGAEEISSRVNLMAILLTNQSEEFSSTMVKYIMENENKYHLLQPIKSTDGAEEHVRIQLLTIILSLMKPLIKSSDLTLLDNYMGTFHDLLDTEPSPLVRIYIEWIICLYSNEVQLTVMLSRLVDGDGDSKIKPSRLISYQRILFLAIKQLPKSKEEQLLNQFITVVLPEATSNKVIMRHFSLSLITSIYDEVNQKNLAIEHGLMVILESLYQTAVQSESFGLYRSGSALLWDSEQDYNLLSLSGRILLRITDRDDLPNITPAQANLYLSEEQRGALDIAVGDEHIDSLWAKPERAPHTKFSVADSHAGKTTPLQTKSGAWETTVDVDIENSREKAVVRSDLIVVASLVDKPPNLGGICRLCDVLGAGLLALHDIRVKNHTLFKTVAVTADNWMPMVEVTPNQIRDFILEKKTQGYTLIGLEQTDNSIELNSDFQFPKKSLIVLGAEKEGIRGDLLAELDCCLEIKQVGVIRSMNIQTATAIIVHAYSSQHC
ncbi:uncharacterized protein KQ657_002589 [Scheffersomyces spartinae]|uniref:tRNA/rRNA methyltransferase SpoU type domain-containing protein n=1 Tax=Scheffersomyces spartinae TaxID=45513 RepID=A0A9P8AGT7_9ASCO|nr:uncharacterized protein KQ657_002589 [Scheffersomyces spartinae]KAG7191982.1 hypothetical protein KQ657_002589 [Scheffersomyces spartinae]